MEYQPQVSNQHYESINYDPLHRFVSYYNQKTFIINRTKLLNNPTILEIGKGNGFLYNYLINCNLNIKSFDFDKDLKPDYIGDLSEIEKIVHTKFDIICCFEVFEHIQYTDLSDILKQLSHLCKHDLIISVPQYYLYLSVWIKIPVLKPFQIRLSIPLPRKHFFDGQHYWELGKKNYSPKNFRKLLSENFLLISEYTDPLDPYHRFFVLRVK